MTKRDPEAYPSKRPQVSRNILAAIVSYLMVTAVSIRGLITYPKISLQIAGLLSIFILLMLIEPLLRRQENWGQPLYIIGQVGIMIGLFILTPLGDFWSILLLPACIYVMRHYEQKIGWAWIGVFVIVMCIMISYGEGWRDAPQFIIIYIAAYVLVGSYALMLKETEAARAESQQLLHQLQQSNAQLQEYVAQVEELTTIKERNRLARELHDAVTQSIFSMTLITRSALILQDRDPHQVKDKLFQLQELAQGALQEMRGLISQLRTISVTEDGLFPVLEKFVEGVKGRNDLVISIEPETKQLPLSAPQQQELYRIIQEAINNIVKHAQCDKAVVRFSEGETAVSVTITDNGIGFDPARLNNDHTHFGLTSMRERAKEIGGTLTINTQPEVGTEIVIFVPIEGKQKQNE